MESKQDEEMKATISKLELEVKTLKDNEVKLLGKINGLEIENKSLKDSKAAFETLNNYLIKQNSTGFYIFI